MNVIKSISLTLEEAQFVEDKKLSLTKLTKRTLRDMMETL